MKFSCMIASISLLTIAAFPLVSQAQTVFTPTVPTIQTLPAVPASCPLSWCSALNQYISAYNSYTSSINEINRMGMEIQSYARYPQQVQTNFAPTMQQIANILSQNQRIDYQASNAELQVSQLWPNYVPGTPLAALNSELNTMTASSVITTLKGTGILSASSTDASVTQTIAAIRAAAAKAVNPTQATQVEVQLLSLMWEQQVKEQRLLELRMSQDAQHDLREAAMSQQQLQYDQSLVQSLQTSADATPPHFSQSMINAFTSPATFGGH